jgi:hypothetical protein
VFRNIIPNIFRVLGVPASNVLPGSRRRKAYALIVCLLGLACEGFSFFWYLGISGIIFVWVRHFEGPLADKEPQFFATGIMFIVLIILPVSNLFSFLAKRLRTFSQRLLVQNADEIRKFDSRHPILLLRSFADDQISLRTIHRSRHIKLLQLFDSGVHINTLDELLVQRYSYIGPVIAMGNPKDEIPRLGASRKYVKGTAWEEIVVSLMRQSAIVVIAVGDTESLLWEVHQLGLLDLHRRQFSCRKIARKTIVS